MVALVTALTSGLITWNARKMLFAEAESGLAMLAADATTGAATEVQGALKFRKADIVQSVMDNLAQRSKGRLLGGFAFDIDMKNLASTGTVSSKRVEQLQALAKTAMETGQFTTDASGMLVAAPATVGNDAEVVGVVAIAWTAQGVQEQIAKLQNRASIVALAAFLTLFALSALFLQRALRRPMQQIEAEMTAVANGTLEGKAQLLWRKDEVGALAKALEIMRQNLIVARSAEELRLQDAQDQQRVVQSLSEGLHKLANGDLSYRLSDDFPEAYLRLRNDFHAAVVQLGLAVTAVVSAGQRISTAARTIQQQSDHLSQRTENQAATLEQTAAALDELTTHVKSTATATQNIDALVQGAEAETSHTGEIVSDSIAAMQEIELFSKKITAIISVIDDIAFQTNLLALNAGVEAARAGETGRGFAVVASEVGALAQRSSNAAREITALITSSSNQVSTGVQLVGRAGVSLTEIVTRVQSVAQSMRDITEGTAMQSSGLNEINIGIGQLDQVTQRNAAMVVEASAAAEVLNNEVEALLGVVAQFKLHDGAAAQSDTIDAQWVA